MSVADRAGDAELLAAIPRDEAAFEAFYGRYFERVTAFAAQRCSCTADVADVVAQTFVRLLSAAQRYDPGRAQPSAFVFGIAANVIRDLHRSSARRHALVSKLAGRDLLDDDDIERIETAIDAAQAAGAVNDALREIPVGERVMVELVAEGRTPGEAADELGISPGAAWTRLSRARRRLRDVMNDVRPGGS